MEIGLHWGSDGVLTLHVHHTDQDNAETRALRGVSSGCIFKYNGHALEYKFSTTMYTDGQHDHVNSFPGSVQAMDHVVREVK